tara:strand:- start:2428 stop:3570 length:1143 start_codon:yes stop_codon:yes gene_type:complete
MMIYITKPCPMTFVSRGFQECQVWFGAKPVREDIKLYDDQGQLLEKRLWNFSDWREGEGSLCVMNAKIFFKGLNSPALFQDMWGKLVRTYKPNYDEFVNNELCFYNAISKLYDEAIPNNRFVQTEFHPDLDAVFGCAKGQNKEDDVANFLRVVSLGMLASDNVEREGMSYREWVLEYEVDFEIGQGENNAWLTKSYDADGVKVWLGSGYQPVFRKALIIDPCFKCVLGDDSRRPAEFNGDSKTSSFNILSCQPLLQSKLRDISAKAYRCDLSKVGERYEQTRSAFYDEHLPIAECVETSDDFFAFYARPEFNEYRSIDLGGDKFDYFDCDGFSPRYLAKMLLEVMSQDVARKNVDAEGYGFKEWVVPIRLDCIWEPPAHK